MMRQLKEHRTLSGAVTHETDGAQHVITTYRRAYSGALMVRPLRSEVVREQQAAQAFRDHVWQLEQE